MQQAAAASSDLSQGARGMAARRLFPPLQPPMLLQLQPQPRHPCPLTGCGAGRRRWCLEITSRETPVSSTPVHHASCSHTMTCDMRTNRERIPVDPC